MDKQRMEPPPGLLMSIALRLDHGLGCPGYYDQPMMQAVNGGVSHARRLEVALDDARKAWEECVGLGFYQIERSDWYVAMQKAALSPNPLPSPAPEKTV